MKLQFVIEAVDKATATVARIDRAMTRSMDRITEPARRVRAALNGMASASGVERVHAAIGQLQERAAGVMGWARGVAGGIAAIGLASMGAGWALKGQIDQVDKMLDQAKKLNIGIEAFQRLGYAAQLNGSSQEEMGGALQFLAQNMSEAIRGSKEAVEWFGRVDLSVAKLRKMSVVQVMEAIADKFAAVGDGGANAYKKIELMRALMGRGGAELKQTLDLGSAGLRKFYAEADRLGAVVSGDAAEAMGDFNDEFDRATIALRGVLRGVGSALLPVFSDLAKRTQAWAVANRELIATRVLQFVDQVLPRLPAVATSLAQIAGGLGTLIALADTFAQVLGGWETVFAVITGVILGKGLLALYGLASALWGVSAAFLATPFGWFVAGAAALAAGAALVIKHWEPIKAFFERLWAPVSRVLGAFNSRITNTVSAGAPSIYAGADAWARYRAAGAGAGPAVAPAMSAASVVSAGAGRMAPAELGGTLKIEIDGAGQARVRELRKAPGSVLDYDVHLGAVMVGS